ncbi:MULTISPECIES: hypothetical protein [Nostoc]|uniref:Uncharacterized protein n=1 Tax=Nostoc paludosum FACHB-159 TaxID=2692908 RepID=A0ABR8K9Z9_9NOSO|nr:MULTISPECIES: hypothetical protein [Nostoc]MBD2679302.1 hypothetical protein [Nostoc sp. FACHB-857]MBD2735686.1 hypothetical protein [Nostoc paludosum FACHB-159]
MLYTNNNKVRVIDSDRATYPPKKVTLLTQVSATFQNILAGYDKSSPN